MGPKLASLLKLQSIENDLTHVRRRLRSKENALRAIDQRVAALEAKKKALHEDAVARQAKAGGIELELKQREQEVQKLRNALNAAKTNKEYAAILTEINTQKADNSKLEDEVLKIMQGVDAVKSESAEVDEQIQGESAKREEIASVNAEEIAKLNAMKDDLLARRSEAAKDVSDSDLELFDRLSGVHDGEAMAPVEVTDEKRGEYSCGGCFMALRAEHYNALLSKDEIRQCESCGRILYIEIEAPSPSGR